MAPFRRPALLLPCALRCSPHEAHLKIARQIARGHKLAAQPIDSHEQMETARADCGQWEATTATMLMQLFTTDSREREFCTPVSPQYDRHLRLSFNVVRYRGAVRDKTHRLEHISAGLTR